MKGSFSINNGEIKRKVNAVCSAAGITVSELCERMDIPPSTMSVRLKRGRFTKDELEKIAESIGVEYECYFELSDGTII